MQRISIIGFVDGKEVVAVTTDGPYTIYSDAHDIEEERDRLKTLLRESVDNGDKIMAELKMAVEKCVELKAENAKLREALERLARLGNEPYYGNSLGNEIAKDALKEAKP